MADFDPVVIDLTDKIDNPGDSLPVSGRIDVSSYTAGEKEFSFVDGIAYDVVLTNAGDGVLASGLVRASVTGECDRCLEPASFDVAGEIEEYFLFEEPEDPEAYEDGFDLVSPERTVDLSDAIADAVVMDTPFVVLCRPDCAGLCPTCGANLNHETCSCERKQEESWADDARNPFAALKDLKFDE